MASKMLSKQAIGEDTKGKLTDKIATIICQLLLAVK
jgi:hypothetical protein